MIRGNHIKDPRQDLGQQGRSVLAEINRASSSNGVNMQECHALNGASVNSNMTDKVSEDKLKKLESSIKRQAGSEELNTRPSTRVSSYRQCHCVYSLTDSTRDILLR